MKHNAYLVCPDAAFVTSARRKKFTDTLAFKRRGLKNKNVSATNAVDEEGEEEEGELLQGGEEGVAATDAPGDATEAAAAGADGEQGDAVGEEGELLQVGEEGAAAAGADGEQGDAVGEEGELLQVGEEGAGAPEDDTLSDDTESDEQRDENQDKIIEEYARKLFAADDPRMNSFGTQLVSLNEEEKNFAILQFKASNQSAEKAFYTPLQWDIANENLFKQCCVRGSQYTLTENLLKSIKKKLKTDQMPLTFLTQATMFKLVNGTHTWKANDVHLDLFFRLIPQNANFIKICRKLFFYYGNFVEIPDKTRSRGKFKYSETQITKMDFAELFLTCLYYFNRPLKAGTANTWESQKSTQTDWLNLAFNLQTNLVCTFDIGSCENLKSDDLKWNYGLFVSIKRTFQIKKKDQTQIITLQLNDPINFAGLSLYYSEFSTDTTRDSSKFVNMKTYAKKWILKSPKQMLADYIEQPEELWKKVYQELNSLAPDTIVCETPIEIKKKMIDEYLAPGKWLSMDIVHWWLASWCERLPDTTFFTYRQEAISKSLTSQGSFVKEKILCVSSYFYEHIKRDAEHPENPSNNELTNLQIFKKSFKICFVILKNKRDEFVRASIRGLPPPRSL
jgi:hypothetical protein